MLLSRKGWLACCVVVLGLLAGRTVLAEVTSYGEWQVSCSVQGVDGCFMALLGKDPQTDKTVYRIGVRNEVYNGRRQPLLKVLVPLGVSLMQAPELTVAIDRPSGPRTFELDYSRCVEVGCLAIKEMSPELDDFLRNGHTAYVKFTDGSGKVHNYPVSLAGSTKALERVYGS